MRSGTDAIIRIGDGSIRLVDMASLISSTVSTYDICNSSVRVYGTSDSDSIVNKTNTHVTLVGGSGDDSIQNSGNNASISGGTGDDLISLASSAENVTISYANGDGNDKIYGFNSDDRINITSGKISSSVRSGNDAVLKIGSGKITLVGGASLVSHNVSATKANSKVNGTAYADSIYS